MQNKQNKNFLKKAAAIGMAAAVIGSSSPRSFAEGDSALTYQLPIMDSQAYNYPTEATTKFTDNISATIVVRTIDPHKEATTYWATVGGDFTATTPSYAGKVEFGVGESAASLELTNLKLIGDGCVLSVSFFKDEACTQLVGTSMLNINEVKAVRDAEAAALGEQNNKPTPEPEKIVPSLIIRSSSIGKESINAGDEFKLSLTIYSTTNGNTKTEDVVVSIQPGEGITVASGSSSTYVGSMSPGASKTVSFPMKVLESFTGNVSSINVSVSGSGNGSSTTIAVPVVQADRFEFTRIEHPEILTAGEEDVVSAIFVNKGKNSVNNVTVELLAKNSSYSSLSEYVGNLPAGTENSVDFDVLPSEPGVLSGVIKITYEDGNGKTVEKTQDFSIQVEEAYSWEEIYPGFDDPEYNDWVDVEPEDEKSPILAISVAGIASVAIIGGAILIISRRRKHNAFNEDDYPEEDASNDVI